MRIAMLMLGKGLGGIQTHFKDSCVSIANCGYQLLAVVSSDCDSWLLKQLTDVNSNLQIKTTKVRFGNYDRFAVRKIARILQAYNPDIVVSYGQRASLFAGRVKSTNVKWLLVAPTNGTLNGYYYQFADVLIPATDEQSNPNIYTQLPDRVRFSEKIPHFSTIIPVQQIDSRREINNIFAVGRLESIKGFIFLIEAMYELSKRYSNLHLYIAGEGSEYQNLANTRDQLGLAESVHFLGARTDVHELMKQFDLFVLPSLVEAFGIVLLEAMASGMPIVSTRTEGPLEILNESTSILVDRGSSEALRKGIETVIQHPDYAFIRARNALNVYKSCYTAEVVVPQMLSLFESLIRNED